MKIIGLTKTTLLDYPSHIATTIFTNGCNLKCPYCHNGHLLSDSPNQFIPETEVFEYLIKRRHLIDGICISGGEPTIQPKLPDFARKIKSLNFKIKLDTNGFNPEVIKTLLNESLLDYIAMDIKNTKEKYPETSGFVNPDMTALESSINLIKTSNIPYHFRTTVMKEFHTLEDLLNIGNWLSGSKCFTLQNYRKSNFQASNANYTSFSEEELMVFQNLLSPYFETVTVL